MSGIAGVFQLDGAPVDPAWLDEVSALLVVRGPDGGHVWSEAGAGLCHTLLRTSPENEFHSELEPQPCTLDGDVWIAADARIDARDTLLAKLQPHSRRDLRAASSAQLILHAYARWGVDCVEHLLGDFAFILWDAPRQRVFCARDHLGIKPLYYVQVGPRLLVSNALDCLRLFPFVPADLNDQAIADFLLFGMNREADTTFFSAIRRLPTAHRLVASAEGLVLEKFWDLPIDEPLYLRRPEQYVEQFWELMNASLRDRLPGETLGISMSGGIDSPTLAAASVGLGASPVAFTTITGSDDPERAYACAVAKRLAMPIYVRNLEDEPQEWPPENRPLHTSEPIANVLGMSSRWPWPGSPRPRVLFHGEGPDNALTYEWQAYFAYLRSRGQWGRMARDLVAHIAAHRRIPLLPTLPRKLRETVNPIPAMVFPVWLNGELISRLRLRERWEQFQCVAPAVHPVRPDSDRSLRDVIWPAFLEGLDDIAAHLSFEFRHPFLDLRLLRFFLAVPAMPWCRRKHLLRRALRGRLPEEVLRRPKTPVKGSLPRERGQGIGMPPWQPHSVLSRYLDWNLVSTTADTRNWVEYDANMRAIGLNYWLLGI